MPSSSPRTWEEYARQLGTLLQQQRKSAGMTQEDLAHRAGLTRTHYQQIERGLWRHEAPSNPSVRSLARLAQVLSIEVGELLPPVGDLTWST